MISMTAKSAFTVFRYAILPSPSLLAPSFPVCLSSIRTLNSNRAVVARVRREIVTKTYPTLLVMPDGATIEIRSHVPRRIIKLPIDVQTCSPDEIKRIRHLRRPRGKLEVNEEITATFDPMKYVRK